MRATGTDAPPRVGRRGRGRRLLGLLLAGLVSGLAAVLAAGFWVVAQGQYLEDYCFTQVEPPRTSPPEALSGRPAYWEDPVTVACEYDGFPTIHATELGPLVGALILAGAVLAVTALAFSRARNRCS